MKTNQTVITCYEEYLELCSSLNLRVQQKKMEKLLIFKKIPSTINLPFGTCLIDYSQRKYLHISQNTPDIIGYNSSDYRNGPESHLNRMHPEDKTIFSEQLFPDILRFLSSVPFSEYERYRFSFSYRYYRKNGSISHLLQQSTYLEPAPGGKPLLNMVVFSDISDIKSDNIITLTVTYLTNDRGHVPIYKKKYTSFQHPQISNREMEVLKLSLEGLSSQRIADRLYLSIHTVKNHKRNMMDKTEAKNMSELIHFAVKNKLIYY